MQETKEFRWVRDEFKIDFHVPKSLYNEFLLLEELDRKGHWGYFEICDGLDIVCKNCLEAGLLTKKQCEIILSRYDVFVELEVD